jgi:hypothetical protein
VPFPRTPLDLTNFSMNYEKTSFCEELYFSRFTNRCLGGGFYLTQVSTLVVQAQALALLVEEGLVNKSQCIEKGLSTLARQERG